MSCNWVLKETPLQDCSMSIVNLKATMTAVIKPSVKLIKTIKDSYTRHNNAWAHSTRLPPPNKHALWCFLQMALFPDANSRKVRQTGLGLLRTPSALFLCLAWINGHFQQGLTTPTLHSQRWQESSDVESTSSSHLCILRIWSRQHLNQGVTSRQPPTSEHTV